VNAVQWAPVPGLEGLYEVSDAGHVRSLNRVDRFGRHFHGQELSADTIKGGYKRVALSDRGTVTRRQVHHLVLEAFVGPRPLGMEGCHGNGQPDDNRLINLRWDTRPESARDTVRHGTHRNTRKSHCPRNHPLEAPNLVASQLTRGKRRCLACDRARQYAAYHGEPVTQELADNYFTQIGIAA
jgi:hypothetical protein